tara:strand:+ start:327 stop:635 length:309 start_codon:yes stop_codon:yes gene_type:complete
MASNIYPKSSPYYYTDVVNARFLDVMVNRPIPAEPGDVYWEIPRVYQYRPDTLAYDLYGDSKLWWVFAQRNPDRLKDPYFDFVAGISIYLPKMTNLTQTLGL